MQGVTSSVSRRQFSSHAHYYAPLAVVFTELSHHHVGCRGIPFSTVSVTQFYIVMYIHKMYMAVHTIMYWPRLLLFSPNNVY